MRTQQDLTDERNQRFLALLKPVDSDCQRWAYNLAQNTEDANDLYAQSVMTGLINIHQLKSDAAFKTWMFRIIMNNFKLMIRQRKKQPDPMEQQMLDVKAPREDDWTERNEQSERIREILEKLSPDQKQALVLFELHGLNIKEVSAVMRKKETAVRVLLHRARQRMAELLRKEGIGPLLPAESGGTDS